MLTRWFKLGWSPVLVVLIGLILWQLAVAIWHIPSWLLPGPLLIFHESITVFPRVWIDIAATIEITVIGFLCGVTIGLLVAVALHLIPGFRAGFYPLLILSQNIPIIALAPLLVIWFGFGMIPKIIVIILVCFFPIAVAILDGFVQTDRSMVDYMKMIGASSRTIFFKLELPNALPYFFSGLKISATYSVMGAVVAEWLGSEKGIGVFMLLSKSAFRTDRVFVAIFVIVALSLILFGLIVLAERLLIRWNVQSSNERGNIHGQG